MTPFIIIKDQAGIPAYGLKFCDTNYVAKLGTSANTSIVVPPLNAKIIVAVISYTPGSNVLVSDSTTAIAAPTGVFVATAAQLNPPIREVKVGDTLNFYCPDTAGAYVTVSFYAKSITI